MQHLGAYFEHFRSIIDAYDSRYSDTTHGKPVFTRLDDVFAAIGKLRSNNILSRDRLLAVIFEAKSEGTCDPHHGAGLDLVMRVSFMIGCGVPEHSIDVLELGGGQKPWPEQASLQEFIDETFGLFETDPNGSAKQSNAKDFEKKLTARLLKTKAGLTLRPTDDLRNHLLLDRDNNTVEIFHYAGFLKEQLRLSLDLPLQSSTADSLVR